MSDPVGVPDVGATAELWARLRTMTDARIGLGRSGDALSTAQRLDLLAAHAAARDAVHVPLDTDVLVRELADLGLGEVHVVPSAARDRAEYLRRPDLGRIPGPLPDADGPSTRTADRSVGTRVAVVVADGLSTLAVQRHAAATLRGLAAALDGVEGMRLLPPVIATQARVALGDHIGAASGADAVVVLVGERPGLSVTDSLGAYLTWSPRPGRRDSERNCVSNIRTPGGLPPEVAGSVLARLLVGARALGASGVALKDTSTAAVLAG